jgi:hypothetical protein
MQCGGGYRVNTDVHTVEIEYQEEMRKEIGWKGDGREDEKTERMAPEIETRKDGFEETGGRD